MGDVFHLDKEAVGRIRKALMEIASAIDGDPSSFISADSDKLLMASQLDLVTISNLVAGNLFSNKFMRLNQGLLQRMSEIMGIQGEPAIRNKHNERWLQQCKPNISAPDWQTSGFVVAPMSGNQSFASRNDMRKSRQSPEYFICERSARYKADAADPSNRMDASFKQMNPDAVGEDFVVYFYSMSNTNRRALVGLYGEDSVVTSEGRKIKGLQAISNKLNTPQLQQGVHYITAMDCQPSGPEGGLLVFVTGKLQLLGKEHMLQFTQMFHLLPTPQGSFYVHNDIFRLI